MPQFSIFLPIAFTLWGLGALQFYIDESPRCGPNERGSLTLMTIFWPVMWLMIALALIFGMYGNGRAR